MRNSLKGKVDIVIDVERNILKSPVPFAIRFDNTTEDGVNPDEWNQFYDDMGFTTPAQRASGKWDPNASYITYMSVKASNYDEIVNKANISIPSHFKSNKGVMKISNVWDRKRLFLHASFANASPNNYLCSSDDPQYNYPNTTRIVTGGGNYELWFSLDGVKAIRIHYAEIFVDLTFILNANF